MQLHQAGALDKADRLYRAVLGAEPNQFDALRCLGFLRYQQGRLGEARRLIGAALTVRPRDVDALANLGAVLDAGGDSSEALATYDKALELDAGSAPALLGRGDVLIRLGRFAEAVSSYDLALAIQPANTAALNNRGVALRDLRRPAEALASHDAALAIQPGDLLSLINRGAALCDLKRPDEALACYERAIEAMPDDVSLLINRGVALRDLKRPAEALASYERAIVLRPDSALAANNRGVALCDLGLTDQALASFDQAIQLRPGYAEAIDNKIQLLTELGRFDDAQGAIERVISVSPRRARSFYQLALVRPFQRSDAHFQALVDNGRDIDALGTDDRIFLDFALAKALADVGDHEGSFQRLTDGNRLKRSRTQYDEAAVLSALETASSTFTGDLIRRNGGGGEMSSAPVFIVGMPRSGTTLVEQILASHSKVFAAGEIAAFHEAALEQAPSPASFPDAASTLSRGELRQLGKAYLDRIRRLAPDAEKITNKTTDNFRFAGLIHLALPNARIVHVRRDPIDTCLSCYSKLFFDDLPYAYDLQELCRYYRAYEALMAHWRQVLPPGVMLEVRYEEVVSDLEVQARRIVAHCGLAWDPRCLDFHLTQRPVRTASAAQVRRAIYQSSVGRWRSYAPYLGALIDGMQHPAPGEASPAG